MEFTRFPWRLNIRKSKRRKIMAKEKKMVEAITSMDVDFAQ